MSVIGYAGMTHLGLNSAAAAAARGFAVIGWDSDSALVSRLRQGALPVVEPGLDELVAAYAARLSFTYRVGDLAACDVVVIAADVPTDDAASSDLAPIHCLIDAVAPVLKPSAVLVVLCQVPPGFTRSLTAVPHDRLFYQVETLIFGRAVERATQPERFILGCADPARPLPPAYGALLEAFGCPILPMRYESAELAKIAINFCLVASIAAANTLAEVAEAVGADWGEVVPSLRLDRRIGPHAYLSPGLGIAGGNLERDLRTVIDIAESYRTDAGVVRAWLDNSSHRRHWPARVLETGILAANPDARIAILGLAYKENTHSTRNSPALALLERLKGRRVSVHDPVVPYDGAAANALACAEGADALVITTPWPEYRRLSLADLARVMAGRILLDPYRVLDGAEAVALGFTYHTLGRPAERPETLP